MKKILITGANSYIGTSFETYMAQWPDQYQIDTVDMIDGSWREKSFSGYDVVFHVAGIAHIKETKENAHLYYVVNRDLAIETAKKAKADGVSHFIFLSSMSVYGMDQGEITAATIPAPISSYGKSKLQAEQSIAALEEDSFCVSMARPPMVYGKNCRGNFQLMRKLVEKSPIFPSIKNERSMISITNLCCFIRLLVDRRQGGIFFPQNKDYVNTTVMARLIAQAMERNVWFSKSAGLAIRLLIPFFSKAKKAFASLTYRDLEVFDYCYCEESFTESIQNSI